MAMSSMAIQREVMRCCKLGHDILYLPLRRSNAGDRAINPPCPVDVVKAATKPKPPVTSELQVKRRTSWRTKPARGLPLVDDC